MAELLITFRKGVDRSYQVVELIDDVLSGEGYVTGEALVPEQPTLQYTVDDDSFLITVEEL